MGLIPLVAMCYFAWDDWHLEAWSLISNKRQRYSCLQLKPARQGSYGEQWAKACDANPRRAKKTFARRELAPIRSSQDGWLINVNMAFVGLVPNIYARLLPGRLSFLKGKIVSNLVQLETVIEQDAVNNAAILEDFAKRVTARGPEDAREKRLRSDMEKLRKQLVSDVNADKSELDDYHLGVRTRRAKFLALGFPLAIKMISPEYNELTDKLISEMNKQPSYDRGTRFTQIAQLQLGRLEGKKWVVPANRHKRIAHLYRIFDANPEAWPIKEIEQRFIGYEGGENKLAREHSFDAAYAPTTPEQRQQAMNSGHYIGKAVAMDASPDTYGKDGFALALVSFEPAGGIAVHEILKGTSVKLDTVIDKFCREQLVPAIAYDLLNGGAEAAGGSE